MEAPTPESYGWLAALCLALVTVLTKVISKLVAKSEDTLAIVLRRDLDALEHAFQKEQQHNERLQAQVTELETEVKVLKARLGLNGESGR